MAIETRHIGAARDNEHALGAHAVGPAKYVAKCCREDHEAGGALIEYLLDAALAQPRREGIALDLSFGGPGTVKMEDRRQRAHQIEEREAVKRVVTRHQRHASSIKAVFHRAPKRREAMHNKGVRCRIGRHPGAWTEHVRLSCDGEALYLEPGGWKMPREIVVISLKAPGRFGEPAVADLKNDWGIAHPAIVLARRPS